MVPAFQISVKYGASPSNVVAIPAEGNTEFEQGERLVDKLVAKPKPASDKSREKV